MKTKILILNSFLRAYTGSEIVTLDLAKTFKKLGFEVSVATFELSNPLYNKFRESGLEVQIIYNLPNHIEYDLIWAHHFTTIEHCIFEKNISAKKIIFSSLSSHLPLESPPLIVDKISLFLANSVETKDNLSKNYGIPEEYIRIFPNPVSEEFFSFKKELNGELNYIAIISNHIPIEILNTIPMLENKNIHVDVYGLGFKEELITPEILLKYDAVITIGKTVQYSLSLGIPVYCYDIWGGVGWLTQKNIEVAENYNFSGRETKNKKKEPIQILNELTSYSKDDFIFYKEFAKNRYRMLDCIASVLSLELKPITLPSKIFEKLPKIHQSYYSLKLYSNDYIQLFFSEDDNFSENNSFRNQTIINNYNLISFNLNEKTSFRLDLTTKISLISELKIVLYTDDDNSYILDLLSLKMESLLYIEPNKYFSYTTDPKIYFKLNDNVKRIQISFYINDDSNLDSFFLNFIEKNSLLESQISELESNNKENLNLVKELGQKILKIQNELNMNKSKIVSLEDTLENKNKRNLILEKKLNEITNSWNYKMALKFRNLLKFRSKDDYTTLKHSKLFDSKYYLENNLDIKNANIDPILHYLEYGWKEGRNPSHIFDNNFYLNDNLDVKEAEINPLIHYIYYGKKEKRRINNKPNFIRIIKKAFYLLYKNPSLWRKFFFVMKTRGIKDSIIKLINKIDSIDKYSESFNISAPYTSLDKLIENFNSDDFSKIMQFFSKNKIEKPIDILIPIYNGYEFLDKLFESIVNNTSINYRLIIGNDKSPDERIVPFIENFIKNNPNVETIFINNEENLGFLKTVNLLQSYARNHLVILNTDTELPKYWLERLMYPIFIDDSVASTTPFTNSGTICSFPNYLDNNEIYRNLSLQQIDNTFRLINSSKTMLSVPTGVGFCMGMNFNVIQEIGMFDEIYGKGYAEENDWCQRAIQKGYKNIHITNLFVYHKHGGSFLSEDKLRYINEHYQLLLNKFPSYDEQIQNTIKANALKDIRSLMKIMLDFNFISTKNILIFDHDLGGGANLYRKQKINEFLENNQFVLLFDYNINTDDYKVSFYTDNYVDTFEINNEKSLYKLLEFVKIDEVFVNGLVTFPDVYTAQKIILDLKTKFNLKLTFPIHDYFCISPNYTLLGNDNVYTGLPINQEEHCDLLRKSTLDFKLYCNETNAKSWQDNWREFLQQCDEILCFSHSSENIILEAYPNLDSKLVYIPHNISGTFENIYHGKLSPEGTKVIGVLGNINLPKGRNIIKEMINYIETNNLNITIALIGNIDADIQSEHFIKTGNYSKQEVPALIKKLKIDEFFIPSVWPETYSYTTDEIMQLGYPITVFNLGAPAERVQKYPLGKIVDFNNYLQELCH